MREHGVKIYVLGGFGSRAGAQRRCTGHCSATLLPCRSVWTLQSFSAGTTDERGSTGSVGDVVGAEGSAGVLVSAALCLSDTQGCHCNSQRWQFFIHAIMFNS